MSLVSAAQPLRFAPQDNTNTCGTGYINQRDAAGDSCFVCTISPGYSSGAPEYIRVVDKIRIRGGRAWGVCNPYFEALL